MKYRCTQKYTQKGFTIIELMIVVSIIGILASVAIPAYQDYTIRARVSEGLSLASAAKLAVAETFVSKGSVPNQASTGYTSPQPTKNVDTIKIASGGSIIIQYTKKAGNGTLILKPKLKSNQPITWDCQTGTLDPRFRPANCR